MNGSGSRIVRRGIDKNMIGSGIDIESDFYVFGHNRRPFSHYLNFDSILKPKRVCKQRNNRDIGDVFTINDDFHIYYGHELLENVFLNMSRNPDLTVGDINNDPFAYGPGCEPLCDFFQSPTYNHEVDISVPVIKTEYHGHFGYEPLDKRLDNSVFESDIEANKYFEDAKPESPFCGIVPVTYCGDFPITYKDFHRRFGVELPTNIFRERLNGVTFGDITKDPYAYAPDSKPLCGMYHRPVFADEVFGMPDEEVPYEIDVLLEPLSYLKGKMGIGRRKEAVARVFLRPGGGALIINKTLGSQYMQYNDTYLSMIDAPFKELRLLDQCDILVLVRGGGLAGQAKAIQLASSRLLVTENIDKYTECRDLQSNPPKKNESMETNRRKLRSLGLLTRDSRIKERKKYGLRKARKAPQYSKR